MLNDWRKRFSRRAKLNETTRSRDKAILRREGSVSEECQSETQPILRLKNKFALVYNNAMFSYN